MVFRVDSPNAEVLSSYHFVEDDVCGLQTVAHLLDRQPNTSTRIDDGLLTSFLPQLLQRPKEDW